jgi:mRNA-degrading endonuclease RelE of RelBE toxin-antitoxin system
MTMGKKIAWTDQGQTDLRAIERNDALRILHIVSRYLATGEGDVKRLRDIEPPEFRLRAGDYRVRFRDLGDSILVLAVKHRREAYR